MRLIIVSGLSGSGKSVALAMLEDLDYYCVDNIPAGLLPGFIAYTVRTSELSYRRTAAHCLALLPAIAGRFAGLPAVGRSLFVVDHRYH